MCSSTWNSNHHKNEDEESGHNKSNNNNNNSNSIDHHVHNNYTNNILNDDENLHISRRYEQQDYHNDDRNVSNHIHQTNLRLALEAAFRPGQEQQEANDVINITDDVKSHVDWDVVNEILRNLVNLPSSSDSSLTSSSLLSEVVSNKANEEESMLVLSSKRMSQNKKKVVNTIDFDDPIFCNSLPSYDDDGMANGKGSEDDDMDLDQEDHGNQRDDIDDCPVDPDGRQLVCKLLSCDPPLYTVQLFLSVPIFQRSLHQNPAAFFTVSRFCLEPNHVQAMTKYMMGHIVATHSSCPKSNICPYPWLLSSHISVQVTRAILETVPNGVWLRMSSTTPYGLLDHFLWSDQMVARREWDFDLWMKFKLVLVAAECRYIDDSNPGCNTKNTFSPIRIILERILAKNDFFHDLPLAQHVLWLLHHLRGFDRWIFSKPSSKDGLLPLHFLVSHKLNSLVPSSKSMEMKVDQTDTDSPPVGLVIARELCKVVIAGFPEATKQPMEKLRSGQHVLPLHNAIENGWPCHDLMLSVFPESLEIADPRTGLFPFQTAAACSSDDAKDGEDHHRQMALNVTFELLRSSPLTCAIEASSSVSSANMTATRLG
mmetsp:Transcript_41751/g.100190  ORF Transcript_41751/g.100190 Transcript_41751/m.100190 type:complete len:598 (+) Transcript_41751:228-2021(+)